MRKGFSIAAAALMLAGLVSCSTTRVLEPGESRLARNEVTVTNDPAFKITEISQYIKQQPNSTLFGWSPGLCIYNWGKTDKGLGKFWHKLGSAPVVFDPFLVESSCRNIEQHLEYLGYYDSDVQAEVGTEKQLSTVHYIVTLGKQYVIDEMTFSLPENNEEFISHFRADSASMLVHPGSILSEALLEEESARSATVLRDIGYYGFSKNNYFFVADTLNPENVILDYAIKGYTRNEMPDDDAPISKYHVGKVSITHSAAIPFRESVLKRMNLIRPGEPYNENIINTTYNRFSSLKVFNGISIEMTPSDSATVDCNIRLSESKVQGIKVNGEVSYSSSGLLGFSPQLSWYHKNIFHGGEWLNLGFTGNFQVRPSDHVHATEMGVNASLSLPRFVGLPYSLFTGSNIPRTEIRAAYSYQNRPEYVRTLATFSYGYTWQHKNFYYQVYPFSMQFINLPHLDPEFAVMLNRNPFLRDSYKSHLDAGVNGTAYHTTNSAIVPKGAYSYERLNIGLSGNILGLFKGLMKTNEEGQGIILGAPFTQYVSGELILGRTFEAGNDGENTLATRLDIGAGYAYGNSTALPFEQQFYVGGASSMRGWQARSLGPGAAPTDKSFSIPSQTGNLKLEADLEYRFKLVSVVEGALFTEVGNVWNMRDINKDFLSTLAADWGLGIRVNLDFIVARLDLGVKLYEPSADPGLRWRGPDRWLKRDNLALHFGVGYPF